MCNQLEAENMEVVEVKISSDSGIAKTPLRVLHVDDDVSMLEVSKQILMLEGDFEIDHASCVDEAFQKLSTSNYDVVVSDYEMPQKDGLDFLRQLKEQKNETPFILFTGKGREEVAIKALNLGADGYFNKQGSPETVYGELAHGIRMVTNRKKAEQLLTKSEEQLKAIVLNAPIGIATSDSNKYFLSANESFCRILGFSENELRKLTFEDITHDEDMQESFSNMEKLASGQIPFFSQEKRYIRKDGAIINGRITVSTIRDKGGKPALFIAELQDITERKRAELEMQEKYEVLERVAEGIGAGLTIIGKDYRVVWANSVLRNLGVSANKKCYQTFNNLETVCPDCGVKKILEKNVPLDFHEYNFTNSKGGVTWVELRATPLKDKEGNITAALELAVPITERKKAEERLSSFNEKLRVVGGLTRHNVRNKLSVIKVGTYLLSKKFDLDLEAAKYLSSIDSAVAMADRLLEFSGLYEKIGAEEHKEVDVKLCFDEAVALINHLNGTKFVNECIGLTVVADSLLSQLFYNLIDNSLKHGEKVTEIRLHYTKDDSEIKLFYEDDGVGISAENKLGLFKEGFSTGGSTGFGLFLSKKMIEVYGWTIEEIGEFGKGAKFVITIPKTNDNQKINY